jgi:hypothetical protein
MTMPSRTQRDPPLTFWRTRPPPPETRLGRLAVDDVTAAIVASIVPKDDEEGILLNQLCRRADGGIPAFRLAQRYAAPGRDNDLYASLLLVAANTEFDPGVLALVQELLALAEAVESDCRYGRSPAKAAARRLRTLAALWLKRRPLRSICVAAPRWMAALQRTTEPLKVVPRTADRAPDSTADPVASGMPRRRVIEEIGDAESSEGRAISRRYEQLLKPLVLRGGAVDLGALETVLTLEAPNFEALVTTVLADLRLLRWAGAAWARFQPVLMVGPAGCGKTRIAKRIATLLGTGSLELSAAGASDARFLCGTARGWSNAQPSAPVQAMLRCWSANPVIIVDEVDKCSPSRRNGNVWDALLPLLERDTARTHFDECLLAAVDASEVSWVLTANATEGLPAPLLSRVTVVPVKPPDADAFEALLAGALSDIASELEIRVEDLPELGDTAVAYLRTAFSAGCSVRELKRLARKGLGYTAALPRVRH